jgi:hypothetical protein
VFTPTTFFKNRINFVFLIIILVVFSTLATSCTSYKIKRNIEPAGAGEISCDSLATEGVTLTAIPSSGYYFDCWKGAAEGSSCTIEISLDLAKDKSKDITASFKPIELIPLRVQGYEDTQIKNQLVTIEQSYPGTDLKDNYHLKDTMKNAQIILGNIGVNVVEADEPYDGELTINITGEALGDYYSRDDLPFNMHYYSGASFNGEVVLIVEGQLTISAPIDVRIEPMNSVMISGQFSKDPADAPFWNILDDVLFQGLKSLWGADVILANLDCQSSCIRRQFIDETFNNTLGNRAKRLLSGVTNDELIKALSNPNGNVRRAAAENLKDRGVEQISFN